MSLKQAYRGGYMGRPRWWLHFTYDEELIERLKALIPASQRTWDERASRWWIADDYEREALRLFPALEAYKSQGALL